jgi:uncharacterized protein YecT (DUF1311 family)
MIRVTSEIGTLSARLNLMLSLRERMKMPNKLPTAVFLVLIAAGVGCRESKDMPEVASVGQDTMLLKDLAEANKNTAAAAAVDNSLNTVRTTGGVADSNLAPSSAVPRTVIRPSQTGSQVLTTPRPAPPLKANDAPGPTTVSTDLSPASRPLSSGDPCDSPAAVDQRACLNRSIVRNDADLNRIYQELIAQSRKSGGPELEQRFREAQRNWVNQRDVECRNAGDGALWAKERARCLAAHSETRTAELRRNLNSLRGQ